MVETPVKRRYDKAKANNATKPSITHTVMGTLGLGIAISCSPYATRVRL
jgi:hypothetical protein